MEKAKKVQQSGGQKGNRNYHKEDLFSKHKKSKIDLKDPRVEKVKLMITHPSRCVLNTSVELFKLPAETRKWEKDGYKVQVIN